MYHYPSRQLAWIAIFHLLFAVAVYANPNHKVMDLPLAIHGKLSSPPWHTEATKLHNDASAKLRTYLEKEKNNGIKSINCEDLGKTHLMVTMMGRGGEWLEAWGEPAGPDFKRRAGIMHGHLDRIVGASLAYPATQKYIDNFRLFLARTTAARNKALANIEKLCNEQKWQEAETALFRVFDTLEPGIIFLPIPEREPIYKPFNEVSAAIRQAMTAIRATASAEEIKKAILELAPNYVAVLQEMNAAAESVAATGNATWRGEMVTGPQLVEKIGQAWREIQVQAHNLRGKNWALSFRLYSSGMYHETSPLANQNNADPIATEFATFSQQVMKTLNRLVEVAGTRADADGARGLYVDYLRALAPLVRQTNDRAWGTQLEAALTKFQGKNPSLDREIKAYAAATSEVLRWRARVASAQAAAKGTDFAPIFQRLHAGTLSGKINDTYYSGLFPEPPASSMEAQFLTAAPEIMPVAIQRLVGQKATLRDVIRIAPDSKASIARYVTRTYANIPAPLPIQGEVAALQADLLVSENAPPMTLAAMQAVVTAERGDMVAVGGEITGMHLEAVVTRFAALPVSAAVLTTLGQLPPEKFEGNSLQNAVVRFEIAPRWAQHDYFFVNLPPPTNQTASR